MSRKGAERERRGREREGDTEAETGSRLWAVSTEPDAGLQLMDRKIMTWAEVGRLTDWATQVPLPYFLKYRFLWSKFLFYIAFYQLFEKNNVSILKNEVAN